MPFKPSEMRAQAQVTEEFPVVSKELIEALEKRYPDRAMNPASEDAAIRYGAVTVV